MPLLHTGCVQRFDGRPLQAARKGDGGNLVHGTVEIIRQFGKEKNTFVRGFIPHKRAQRQGRRRQKRRYPQPKHHPPRVRPGAAARPKQQPRAQRGAGRFRPLGHCACACARGRRLAYHAQQPVRAVWHCDISAGTLPFIFGLPGGFGLPGWAVCGKNAAAFADGGGCAGCLFQVCGP